MDNVEIYKKVFIESFEVNHELVDNLEYQSVETWDSVGHMVLIAALEEAFDIMIEMDDIIDFSGFEKGKTILAKYDVVI
jgi:acyl carrier protein